MTALLWSRGPTVFDTFYQLRVVRFVAWICPRCRRRNRTVVHRGVTGGPAGRPMNRKEIKAEYGVGESTLAQYRSFAALVEQAAAAVLDGCRN